jgi:hypothetical protein
MELRTTIKKEVYNNINVNGINNNSLKGNKKTKVQREVRRKKNKLMRPQCELGPFYRAKMWHMGFEMATFW